MLGLQSVVHPGELAFVWAAPIKHDESPVTNYHWTISGGSGGSQSHGGGPSESVRIAVSPLAWYTFSVYAEFADGSSGSTSTITAQAGPAPEPPEAPPSTCAGVVSGIDGGGSVLYDGQCHSKAWNYYTTDAREKGGPTIRVHWESELGTVVCGHNNEAPTADNRGNMLWCSVNAEWAKVGG